MWMRRDGIPKDHALLGAHFVEKAVDDRSGGLLPRPRAAARPLVWIAPAQQVKLAGEGNARPAHTLVAGRLPHGDDIALSPFVEVMPQIGEPDGRRVQSIVLSGVPELVEGSANRHGRKVPEQRLDRGRLATIGQWS